MERFNNINRDDITNIIKYYSTDYTEDSEEKNDIKELLRINSIISDYDDEQTEEYFTNLQKYFILSSIEFQSKKFGTFIESAKDTNHNVDLLFDSYLSKKLPSKEIKLYEHFNIKVFTNSSYPSLISYKDKDNIESELWKIYESVFGSTTSSTLNFIDGKQYTKDGDVWKNNGETLCLCDEFIILDGVIPKILRDDRLVFYSALYNYIPDQLRVELESGTTVADVISSISGCIINTSETNFDTKWLEKQDKFRQFLLEICRRTINY